MSLFPYSYVAAFIPSNMQAYPWHSFQYKGVTLYGTDTLPVPIATVDMAIMRVERELALVSYYSTTKDRMVFSHQPLCAFPSDPAFWKAQKKIFAEAQMQQLLGLPVS